MIDIRTLERLFRIHFEEGKIQLTRGFRTKVVEKQNIFEAFASFITGKKYSHESNVLEDAIILLWTISDK